MDRRVTQLGGLLHRSGAPHLLENSPSVVIGLLFSVYYSNKSRVMIWYLFGGGVYQYFCFKIRQLLEGVLSNIT